VKLIFNFLPPHYMLRHMRELLELLASSDHGRKKSSQLAPYVLKIKGYIDNLERLGHPVTLGLGVSLILISLCKEYDGFVQNYNMHNMGKTVNELHAMLKLHEQTLSKNNAPALNAIRAGKVQKGNKHKKSQSQMAARGQNRGKGKNKQAYAPKPKIPPPPKRENLAKDLICRTLEEELSSVFSRVAEEEKERSFWSWWFRKLKLGALSLYVGNGQHKAVEAIVAFYLCLPSGLEIVLNNCYYAPSITRGVIFVSRLYEDGFVNRFVDNIIQVSRNNVVYFSAVPRDGIFEIDLSNSNTNKSFIYAVSNKRAKLDLDSGLGHISKKRIEKLQHDGLLDSSDLRAFEKRVSCMSGKMARKPYTHQVERAKTYLD
nr:zinc finger, CCHC-type [Tanacetum cinerariifolium]